MLYNLHAGVLVFFLFLVTLKCYSVQAHVLGKPEESKLSSVLQKPIVFASLTEWLVKTGVAGHHAAGKL